MRANHFFNIADSSGHPHNTGNGELTGTAQLLVGLLQSMWSVLLMETKLAEAENCRIEISRPSMYVNKFRSYSVYLDGIQVGQIRDGESIALIVSPGKHNLWVKIDWLKSNYVEVEIWPNQSVELLVVGNQSEDLKKWGLFALFSLMISIGAGLGGIPGAIGCGIAGLILGQYACRPVLEVPP